MRPETGIQNTALYAREAATGIDSWDSYNPTNLERGFEPLETFPAKWFNSLMYQITNTLIQIKRATDNMHDELASAITGMGIPLDATVTNQLFRAIQQAAELKVATAAVLGGVKASAAAWKVNVDAEGIMSVNQAAATADNYGSVKSSGDSWKVSVASDGTMSVNQAAATSASYGSVKSKTTGTTANRDYDVEVKSDGTMKVNVPWTDTNTHKDWGLKLNGNTLSIASDSTGYGSSVNLPSVSYFNSIIGGIVNPSGSLSDLALRLCADNVWRGWTQSQDVASQITLTSHLGGPFRVTDAKFYPLQRRYVIAVIRINSSGSETSWLAHKDYEYWLRLPAGMTSASNPPVSITAQLRAYDDDDGGASGFEWSSIVFGAESGGDVAMHIYNRNSDYSWPAGSQVITVIDVQ